MALSDNSKNYLKSLLTGPGHVPAIVSSKLKADGYVEKVEGGPSGGRGQSYVKLTAAGTKAAQS